MPWWNSETNAKSGLLLALLWGSSPIWWYPQQIMQRRRCIGLLVHPWLMQTADCTEMKRCATSSQAESTLSVGFFVCKTNSLYVVYQSCVLIFLRKGTCGNAENCLKNKQLPSNVENLKWPETHIKRQATRHDYLSGWLGNGNKWREIVCSVEKNILYWAD
jgi:hypothetical protein